MYINVFVRNAAKEMELLVTYQNIRLMKPARIVSSEPITEFQDFATTWTRPELEYLRDGASFSAICLFFGQTIYDDFIDPETNLYMPIG